jgi:large-conductance mechanosensitive channel
MSLLKGFREFVMCGNVVDLAVVFIVSAAFSKIVLSLVRISSCHYWAY